MSNTHSSVEPVYTLKQAVEKFFPNGTLTVASLRNEIKKGRLRATMPAGKLLVTERAIAGMLKRCRVNPSHHDSTSSDPSGIANRFGKSETERIEEAQASIRATGELLKKRSRAT
jgi:hypothetical protein